MAGWLPVIVIDLVLARRAQERSTSIWKRYPSPSSHISIRRNYPCFENSALSFRQVDQEGEGNDQIAGDCYVELLRRPVARFVGISGNRLQLVRQRIARQLETAP